MRQLRLDLGISLLSPNTKSSPCPGCGGEKKYISKLCMQCATLKRKPPVLTEIFMIDGEPCRKLPLTKGQYAIVNEFDYEWLMQWHWHAHWNHSTNSYYASRTVNRYRQSPLAVAMHRELLAAPSGVEGDHKNRNTLDNRRRNLRPCTRAQNMANSQHRKGRSRYRGLTWDRSRNVWRVRVRNMDYGRFSEDAEETAARFYDHKAKEIFGEFAILNFPT